MTPEERDRLTRVEARQDAMDDKLSEISADVKKLLAAAAMAQGGWWLAFKVCGALVVLLGAIGWVYDRLPGAK